MRCRRSTSIRRPTSFAPTASSSSASPRRSCRSRSAISSFESMLIVQKRIAPQAHADAELRLAFEEGRKARQRTALVAGEGVALFLDRGAILQGGDCLVADDGQVVRVVAAPEALMEVKSGDAGVQKQRHLLPRHE